MVDLYLSGVAVTAVEMMLDFTQAVGPNGTRRQSSDVDGQR